MNCPSQAELAELVDNSLTAADDVRVSAHVETCAACQATLTLLTALPVGPRGPQTLHPLPSALAGLTVLLPRDAKDESAASPSERRWPALPGYDILSELGRGGMGVVYKAHDRNLNRLVAVKMILDPAHSSPEQLVRFLLEAEMCARVQHPNIVQIYEVGRHDGRPYFVLEYLDGGTLAACLAGQPQPPRSAAALVEVLARAVHVAHGQGVVHRDLKPANILLGNADCRLQIADLSESERGRAPGQSAFCNLQSAIPKLTDFGLARPLARTTGLTASGAIVGTPEYMAPEQTTGHARGTGIAIDVWALGVLLYEVLTGRVPFRSGQVLETLRQIAEHEPAPIRAAQPTVPADLETICRKCLEKEPSRRYPTAEALADDLHRFLAGEPIRARPVGRRERLVKWARRRPQTAVLLVLVCVLFVAGFTGITLSLVYALAGWEEASRHEQESRNARNASQAREAGLLLERGQELAEKGEVASGLHWMLAALEAAPDGADDFGRTVRANLHAWREHHHVLRHLCPHPDVVRCAAFSPDGRHFVTGGEDAYLRVWDAATGQQLGEPLRHPGRVYSAAFSPDGKILATGTGRTNESLRPQYTVHLWDVAGASLSPLGKELKLNGEVWTVAFSPDGKQVLAGCTHEDRPKRWYQGEARLWDSATGALLGECLTPQHGIFALAFSPDGQHFLTGSNVVDAPSSRLWDARTQQPLPAPRSSIPGNARCFSPDGQAVATILADRSVSLWNVAAARSSFECLHPQRVRAVAFHPSGQVLATGCQDGLVRFWDTRDGRSLGSAVTHDSYVLTLAFSADGRQLLTGGWDRTLRVWDFAPALLRDRPLGTVAPSSRTPPNGPPDLLPTVPPPTRVGVVLPAQRAVFTAERKWLLAASPEGCQVWATDTGQQLSPPLAHPGCRAVAISPDDQWIATAGREVRLWQRATWQPFAALPHPTAVTRIAFSSNSRFLATGSTSDNVVRVWEVATGALRQQLPHHDPVVGLDFSPDGTRLATGTSWDQTRLPRVQLWDVDNGLPVGAHLPHQGIVTHLAFRGDGRVLATGAHNGQVRLWDASNGQPLSEPLPQLQGVGCLRFHPDGQRWLVGDGRGTVRCYDASTGVPLPGAVLSAPGQGKPLVTALSREGRLLLVGYEDGHVRLWDLATYRPLGPAVGPARPVLAVAFQPDGLEWVSAHPGDRPRTWSVPLAEATDLASLRRELELRTGLRLQAGPEVVPLTVAQWLGLQAEAARLRTN